MAKRSDFERIPRDFYPTPESAVLPLIKHLKPSRFVEPCAGNNQLVDILEKYGFQCIGASDIEPQKDGIVRKDVFEITDTPEVYITNPPWDRKILHPLIEHLSDLAPTWLLFDADWVHTKQSIPYLPRLRKILSVGRVKWFPESKMTGKDNCAWYLFDKPDPAPILFIGRE